MSISAFKIFAVSISAAALAACSSSSSPSPAPSPTTPTIKAPSTGSNNTKATTPSEPTSPAIKGNQINFNTNKVAGANQATANTSDVAVVTIDGKAVSFDLPGFNIGKVVNISASNMARFGSGNGYLDSSRFGYIKEGVSGTPALFSQGTVTNNMPATGKATYTGFAAHVANGQVTTPDAKFIVDYGNKTVAGTIGNNVELTGAITGNQFSGTKNGFSTNGYFYGNGAKELGGTYKNAAGTVSGAYGAKK